MPTPFIAIVDDDSVFLTLMQDLLELEGYRAVVWSHGEDAYPEVAVELPAPVQPSA